MLGTQQADVLRRVASTHAERMPVMELEPMAFRAAAPLLVQMSKRTGQTVIGSGGTQLNDDPFAENSGLRLVSA